MFPHSEQKRLNFPVLTTLLPNLDQLDFLIFRSMGFRPYSPQASGLIMLDPWSIGRKLGVDGKTVKSRMRKMQKLGFIKYYQIYPNYRLLGVEAVAYLLEALEVTAKYEAIQKSSLMDGVLEIYNFIGNTFCVHFAYRDASDHEKRLSLLKELTKCSSYQRFFEWKMPAVNIALNSLDWSILKSLRYNAFKRPSAVAEELEISLKTVKRRLKRMIVNNAVMIAPVIHPGEVPNVIAYGILFYLEEDKRQEAIHTILQSFEPSCLLSYVPPHGSIVLLNFAMTLGETEDALLRAKSIDGVRDAHIYVLKDMREYSEWVDREIAKKIEETGPSQLRAAAE